MKFSLLLELQNAPPTPETERQLFHDTVAQAVLAEECGYGVWAVEHHGLFEYPHCSASEVLLSCLAMRRGESRARERMPDHRRLARELDTVIPVCDRPD